MALAQSSLPATSPTARQLASPLHYNLASRPNRPAAPSHAAPMSLYRRWPTGNHCGRTPASIRFCATSAAQTGMKITAGVADQRVFGKYGPGAPAEILANLLDGTDSNMLLRETASAAPAELILTPQQWGLTPPNPNASRLRRRHPSRDEVARPAPNPQPAQSPPRPRPPTLRRPPPEPPTPYTPSHRPASTALQLPARANHPANRLPTASRPRSRSTSSCSVAASAAASSKSHAIPVLPPVACFRLARGIDRNLTARNGFQSNSASCGDSSASYRDATSGMRQIACYAQLRLRICNPNSN